MTGFEDSRPRPQVYSIAAHRGFADALAAGLLPRYGEGDLGLARLTLLLPSRRAVRTVTEAFIRLSGAEGRTGLLLPRMAVVGDLDLDEALGGLLDPLAAADIPPSADPTRRWLRLAGFLAQVEGDAAGSQAARLRRAFEIGRTIDRLLVEGVTPIEVLDPEVVGIVGELAEHWRDSVRTVLMVQQHWIAELAARGEIDAPERRNRLFDHVASHWRGMPPETPIVAAGVTSASPALAGLLRVVSELPRGAVILPDLDLELDAEVWESLGTAGAPSGPDDPPFGSRDAVTHPQYHLKLLLNRMGIARDEVRPWHRSGMGATVPARSRAISNLFLPPAASARWGGLGAEERRLSGVRLMECAHPGEEAQAIAIMVREALETPERRIAVITPDRGLAGRIVAHLRRWGIEADDTAGRPLTQTAAGRLFLQLAEVVAEQAAPVPLTALLTHPLAGSGERRPWWLDNARRLERGLRGPRPGAGLAPLRTLAAKIGIGEWWAEVEALLLPLFELAGDGALADQIDALVRAAEALCGDAVWGGVDGRALGAFVEQLRDAASEAGTLLDPRELHAVLRDAMDRVSVRPLWGGHPRVAVYGLLEARMSRADLVICAGLVEGSWPAAPAQDSLLPPAVLRALGVPGADFRIGLAAHDLASALGARDVVLSWAQRDEAGPVIPSRFVLRVKAMLGDKADEHVDNRARDLARRIDDAAPVPPHPRPKPKPDAEQRRVDIAVTGLDRLRGDPYQFYASSILRLSRLDALDAEPSPAWQGEVVHLILQRWHEAGEPAGRLAAIAEEVLDEKSAHPLMRALWRPRLVAALDWVDESIAAQASEGRKVIQSEIKGEMRRKGIRIHGRADRIDRMPDGSLAIVDYKTGKPPSKDMVRDGFALQLGLIGMIAEAGGFDGIAGEPATFEYWSLGKSTKGVIGYREPPFPKKPKEGDLVAEDFLAHTAHHLDDAIDRWILGDEPFTARLNPELGSYADYDQLMRLDEWITRLGGSADSGEGGA